MIHADLRWCLRPTVANAAGTTHRAIRGQIEHSLCRLSSTICPHHIHTCIIHTSRPYREETVSALYTVCSPKTTVVTHVPRARTTIGRRSFAVAGPSLWNSLPAALRRPEMTLHTLKRQLKGYLLHIWCVDEQKEHSPPLGVVVAFLWFWRRIQNCRVTYLHHTNYKVPQSSGTFSPNVKYGKVP